MESGVGALFLEQLHDFECRTLTQIVDVALVRNTQHEYTRSLQSFADLIQYVAGLTNHPLWHFRIHVARDFDHSSLELQRAHLPGEVMRIERDAVTAKTGARSKFHEAEWLGGSSIENIPNIDLQALACLREFVDQSDVDHAEGVLVNLHQLGCVGALDRNYGVEDLRVKLRAETSAQDRKSVVQG